MDGNGLKAEVQEAQKQTFQNHYFAFRPLRGQANNGTIRPFTVIGFLCIQKPIGWANKANELGIYLFKKVTKYLSILRHPPLAYVVKWWH